MMAAQEQGMMRNAHLQGDPFFWEGGPDGVLLVHGYTATTAEVRPLAHSLHSKGFTVAGPLLPGHNARPEHVNGHRWRDWVRTVEESYAQLASCCRRVVIGGESTGAILALHLAAAHPEVAAILCYAPALRLTLRPDAIALLYILAPFVTAIPKAKGPPRESDPLWQGYSVNPLKGTIELLRLQRVVRSELAAIDQPLLVMQGRLDETVHPTAPQTIYDSVRSPVKELHWMERSAHTVLIDCERALAFDLTMAFISKVLNRG